MSSIPTKNTYFEVNQEDKSEKSKLRAHFVKILVFKFYEVKKDKEGLRKYSRLKEFKGP